MDNNSNDFNDSNGTTENATTIDPTKKPVFSFISVVLIIITLLYIFGYFKNVPCGSDPLKILRRQFIHSNYGHIVANLVVFYILSRIEIEFGSSVFFMIILQILVISTTLELIVHHMFNIPCSVGFSGVLFGMAVWEFMYSRSMNYAVLLTILAIVIAPSVTNPRASLIGHSLGAFSGLLLSLYYSPNGLNGLGTLQDTK